MIRTLAVAAFAVAVVGSDGHAAGPETRVLSFDELDGWAADNHDAALTAFKETCGDLPDPDWKSLCRLAKDHDQGRAFFELFFRPVLIGGDNPALFTGYFEPELNGSRQKSGRYRYPLYKLPREWRGGGRFATRSQIEDEGLLAGRGLEIAWVDDPVDVFFLQIQGSGRVKLAEGGALRVGFGGANGHNYRSVGQELVRRGIYNSHQVSAQVIKNWVRRNPVAGRNLLQHNPSYVFFREVSQVPAHKGPLGAMNRSITTMRSIAVDPKFTPLGAPVWIEKYGKGPLRRLMIAQDTGSAIKGVQRADIFYGTGADAGRTAGQVKDPGRLVVLLPIQRAFAMALEG